MTRVLRPRKGEIDETLPKTVAETNTKQVALNNVHKTNGTGTATDDIDLKSIISASTPDLDKEIERALHCNFNEDDATADHDLGNDAYGASANDIHDELTLQSSVASANENLLKSIRTATAKTILSLTNACPPPPVTKSTSTENEPFQLHLPKLQSDGAERKLVTIPSISNITTLDPAASVPTSIFPINRLEPLSSLQTRPSNNINYLDIINKSFIPSQDQSSNLQQPIARPIQTKSSLADSFSFPMYQEQNPHELSNRDPNLLNGIDQHISSFNGGDANQEPHKKKRRTIRKYDCQYPACTRSFTTSGHLTRHFKIHTGEKPHICPILHCASIFSRKDNMLQHFAAHQKKLVTLSAPVLFKDSDPNAVDLPPPPPPPKATVPKAKTKKQKAAAKKEGLQWHDSKKGKPSDPPPIDTADFFHHQSPLDSFAPHISSLENNQSLLQAPLSFPAPNNSYLSTYPQQMQQQQQQKQQMYQQFAPQRPRSITTSHLSYPPDFIERPHSAHPLYSSSLLSGNSMNSSSNHNSTFQPLSAPSTTFNFWNPTQPPHQYGTLNPTRPRSTPLTLHQQPHSSLYTMMPSPMHQQQYDDDALDFAYFAIPMSRPGSADGGYPISGLGQIGSPVFTPLLGGGV